MIVSFYSYKGGVGRTQLCANIANYLCFQKNKKVLVWDWDFEAPGLHYFFDKKDASSGSNGTLELFEDYVKTISALKIVQREEYENNASVTDKSEDIISQSGRSANISPELLRYPSRSDMVQMTGSWAMPEAGLIDLMPAGNYSNDFSYRSGNFDWMDFYKTMDGAAYVEFLKEEMNKLGYDYILIDSRTGISDYSGICNIQLPDVNIMVVAATMQNFDGCASIIEKIKNSQYLKYKGKEPKILPVLSRVDTSGERFSQWVQRFNEYFSKTISNLDSGLDPEFVDILFRDIYFRDTFLPYVTAISAGENLFTHDNKQSDTEYKTPFINIARLIEDLNPDMVIKDSLGITSLQNGEINFYEKVSLENWKKYAVDAEDADNSKIAAIAFNQIGIKEADPIKKLAYFQKALDNDPAYQKAQDNIELYYISTGISESRTENASAESNIGLEQPHIEEKPKSVFSSNLFKIAVGLFLAFVILYAVYNTGKYQQTVTQAKLDSLADTAAYTGPLLKASVYFDSIRNLGKPIGIDISSKETIYDQSKVIQYGISFILIKATEGKGYLDPSFNTSWTILHNKKFIAGAYHYYSLKSDPVLQADNFIKNVVISNGDLPPILNLFSLEGVKIDTAVINGVNKYLDRVNIYYGTRPIVYTSEKVASQLFKDNTSKPGQLKDDASRYYLWLSQPNSGTFSPSWPKLWDKWTFWQFSTQEQFNGILSNAKDKADQTVDANQFNGTLDELKAITFKPSSGTRALRSALLLYAGWNTLYQTRPNGKILINKDTLAVADFNKIKFFWSTELINHCFKGLQTRSLYGKSHAELLAYLKKNNLITKASKSVVNIGDIVFLDFEEDKGIQASGIVFNMDKTYLYCLEGSDISGKLKISRFRRHRGDVFLAVTIKD